MKAVLGLALLSMLLVAAGCKSEMENRQQSGAAWRETTGNRFNGTSQLGASGDNLLSSESEGTSW